MLTSFMRGCRKSYDILIKKTFEDVSKCQTKWETTLNLAINLNWKFIFKNPFIYTKDAKLQWLQYRMNNRILSTKHLLQKMGIVIDNRYVLFVNMKMKLLCTYLGNVYMSKPSWRNLKQCVENSQIMN